jgi:hypothetical protein
VAPTAEAIAEAHFKATTDSQNTASSTRDLVAPGVLMASFFTPEDREHAAEVLNKQGVRVTERVGERRLLLDVAAAPDVTEVLKTIAEQRGLRVLEEHSIKPYQTTSLAP